MSDQTETMSASEFRQKAGHKFRAQKTARDGIRFDSKIEARYYDQLVLARKAGEIVGFIRQPGFDLGGGTRYRADFLVFYSDGTCETIDVKGYETKGWKKSWKQVIARYPWMRFRTVTKEDLI